MYRRGSTGAAAQFVGSQRHVIASTDTVGFQRHRPAMKSNSDVRENKTAAGSAEGVCGVGRETSVCKNQHLLIVQNAALAKTTKTWFCRYSSRRHHVCNRSEQMTHFQRLCCGLDFQPVDAAYVALSRYMYVTCMYLYPTGCPDAVPQALSGWGSDLKRADLICHPNRALWGSDLS